ncbi:MAG TPA: patatin-like phospholipase family protein, partial [Pyrinomonadaceae bacterium]|nr:patatin-like phospholipase family protein [Pyrinomonadaceae bacterium]
MASPKPPLFLFQVLEDEYAALHGERPPDQDWQFRASHIIFADSLIKRLDLTSIKPQETTATTRKRPRPQIKATADPDEVAKNALIKYLHDELVRKNFRPNASGAELVAEALNTFLADPNLFAEERFSNYWLNSATRSLRELHTSSNIPGYSSGGPLTGQDLEHFNRLLLEDTFPLSLKKIHRIRLDAIYKCIHEKKPTALCFSGGGIRSGTFALGILQGLARHNLLNKFHFLSTVSGGGYIGSWLAAWIHRHPAGLTGVTTDLANRTPTSKVDPDSDPIRFLRRYSSFITPKVGLLSADTWTFVTIYLRNLLLNWMVFIPLLLSVLTLPRFIVSITTTESNPTAWEVGPLTFYNRHFLLAAGFVCVVWALAYIMFNRPTLKEELRQASPFWRRKTSQ